MGGKETKSLPQSAQHISGKRDATLVGKIGLDDLEVLCGIVREQVAGHSGPGGVEGLEFGFQAIEDGFTVNEVAPALGFQCVEQLSP